MKLQRALFTVIALAFVVSLGSLLTGGSNQKAQVIGGTNSVGVVAPVQGTTLSPGQTIPMTCQVETAPGNVIWQLKFVWFQNNGADIAEFVVDPTGLPTIDNMMSAGNFTKNVTMPSITPGNNFKLQCVAYFYNQNTSSYNSSATQSVSMNFVSAADPVRGCTNSVAINYNPSATFDDGSCIFPVADTVAPSIPTNLRLSNITSHTINVNWNPSSDNVAVAGYRIYRNYFGGQTTGVNTTTPYMVIQGGLNTFTDVGLVSNRSYKYRIRAFDAAGNVSGWGTIQSSTSTTITGKTLIVTRPTNLAASNPTQSSITLSWTTPASGEIYDYEIYAGTTTSTSTVPVAVISASGTANNSPFTHVFEGAPNLTLQPNTLYYFKIKARDPAGNKSSFALKAGSTSATVVSAKTLAVTVPPPTAPSNLNVVLTGNTTATATWTDTSNNETGFTLQRATNSAFTSGLFTISSNIEANTTTYDVTSLSAGPTYYFRVRANATTPSAWANFGPLTMPTPDTTPPVPTIDIPNQDGVVLNAGTPSTPLQVATNESATCKWSLTNTAYTSMTNTMATSNGTLHTSTISNLSNGTSYTVYVRCQDAVGNTMITSVTRAFSVATPIDTTAPSIPTLSVGAITSTTVALSWNAVTDPSTPVTYKIYRNGVYIGSPISGTSMTDGAPPNPLVAGTQYSYTISACDSAPVQNCSVESSTVTATTTAIPTIISSLQVVRSPGGEFVSDLLNGQQLNIGSNPNETYTPLSGSFSIKAIPGTPSPSSMGFYLTGPSGFDAYNRCESADPYVLYADDNGAPYSWPAPQTIGAYTLTVTPYSGSLCSGSAGTPFERSFILNNFDDNEPPNNPSSLGATYRSANKIKISWVASSDPSGINHYKVTRIPGNTINVGNNTSFEDLNVTATDTYSYSVVAVDNFGNPSGVSNSVSSPVLSTAFANGNQVETNATTNLKVAPDAPGNAGTQPAGAVGVITNSSAGPVNPVWVTGSVNYWYVDFATGTDGWVNQNNIDPYVPPPADTTPPTATIDVPTDGQVLSAGTNQVVLTVTTNEAATCRWSATANVAYGSMPTTNTFTGSGTTSHTYPLLGLTDGSSYTRYVRCQNTAGVPMTADEIVTFSVAQAQSGSAPTVSTPQRSFTPNQIAVVCNSQYTQSCQVADYYMAQRGIPTQNKVTLNFSAPMTTTGAVMPKTTFETGFGGTNMRAYVLNQITSAYSSAGLGTPDIQGAVLAWRYPFVVRDGGGSISGCTNSNGLDPCISLVTAFAKGQYVAGDAQMSSGSMPTNAFYQTSSGFLTPRQTHNLIPTFLLPFESGNYNEGKQFVDQGVQADNTYPTGKLYSISTYDIRATPRHADILNISALFNQNNLATSHTTASNYNTGWNDGSCLKLFNDRIGNATFEPSFLKDKTDVIAYHTGIVCPPHLSTLNFLKGALADHLTSHGGMLTQTGTSGGDQNNQMAITELIKAGATASAGTIKEPWVGESGTATKFSKPTQLWTEYYTGASALQSYWSSVEKNGNTNFVGEPLANPWKDPQITFSNNILTISLTHIKPGETWKLQSSTNGTSWTDVSGQTSITAPNGKLGTKIVSVTNATAPYYRLVNNSNTSLPQIVRSVNGSGGGGQPPSDTTPPSPAPTISSVGNATENSLTVSWTTSNDTGSPPVTYRLSRNGTQIVSQAGTSYTDTGLSASTTYNYTVVACDTASIPNCTSPSASSSGATSATPPPPPPSGGQTANGINGPVGPSLTTNATSCTNPSGGTIFYVDAVSGNDSNNGTSVSTPWKTISKVNSSMSSINAGTMICFKRNQTHRGRLAITKSGTASSKIIVDAYGSGSAPVISGNVLVTNWTQHSGNIWKATVSAPVSTPKYLFVNSDYQTLARQPNTGWYFTNSTGGTAITDTDNSWLSAQSSNSLVDGTVLLRSHPWQFSNIKITGNSGSTISGVNGATGSGNISYLPLYANRPWGYLIRNKLSLLDTAGEWYFDSATNTVYLWAPGGANPNSLVVEMTSEADGVYIVSAGHIIVRNLIVEGQTNYAVWLRSQSGPNLKGITIENLEIRNAYHGIYHSGIDGVAESDKNIMRNNYLHDLNVTGISVQGGNGHLIEGNVIERVSAVEDRIYSSSMTNAGIIHLGGGSNIVSRRNIVRDTGYAGIWAAGSGTITENLVERAMKTLTDGAGITFDNTNGLTISKNIVKDIGVGAGQNAGTGGSSNMASMSILYVGYEARDKGLYFGDGTVGPIVNLDLDSNIVINTTDGIWVDHNTLFRDNKIRNNIVYNFNRSGIAFADWSNYKSVSGGCPQPDSNSPCFWAQYNDIATGNKIYGVASYQNPLYFLHSYSNGTGAVADFGTINSNYYSNPYRTTKVQQVKNFSGQTNNWTLAQWQANSNEDSNSTDGTYTATQAPQIFYNATISNTSQVVSGACRVNGQSVSGTQTFTIQPFTAIVVEYGNC